MRETALTMLTLGPDQFIVNQNHRKSLNSGNVTMQRPQWRWSTASEFLPHT